ncbi:hormogonium polysaccharide biosynthesis protein HpsA [Microcoleus sp. S13_B4]|uniref:hormogonium polysaccharide biosynthesis protein HpsA n=1 Tax=Microcoleus sp. S13_B4 TaxID=3055408 RepID=UPI002FD7350D
MFKSKLSKVIVSLLRRIAGVTRSGAKRLMRAMLQALMAMGRRARLPMAGFVLPTVTMVLLVVILLTVAITLRSFDRANTARNVRVNQQVLAAATPALDRAKAKIQFMLQEDPQRPTATPSDNEMYRMMSAAASAQDIYTFGGEERLTVKYDLDGNGTVAPFDKTKLPDAEKDEQINTAWRYPVDTDNNGKFDTFTLYGIYFRSPERKTTSPNAGTFTRARQPLEARTPPMAGKLADPKCAGAAGTSASLVGDSGWYKSEGRLKKSFFVYTVNLPITDKAVVPDTTKYEQFKGTPSFSALEYQQDQSRIPLSNNAVVYEDDLEISSYPALNLNGRIFTNSNLLATTGSTLNLYQVSSKDSCFYDQENSKIIVAGNVVNGASYDKGLNNPVQVHLYKKSADPDQTPKITKSTQSVSDDSLKVLYNNKAYSDRLSLLVDQQMAKAATLDPTSVINRSTSLTRRQALEGYFKERMRKVPFAEVPVGGNSFTPITVPAAPATPPVVIQGTGDTLGPADNTGWNLPTGWTATLGKTSASGLTILPAQLNATYPNPEEPLIQEDLLGDRVQVGNNLPAQRWDGAKFVGIEQPQEVNGSTKWTAGDITKNRTRTTRVTQIADVGATDRAGFWEAAAAQVPKTAVDGIGGLRVITGAGVYDRTNSFLPPPRWQALVNGVFGTKSGPVSIATPFAPENTYDDPATPAIEQYRVVWPDSMPMSPLGQGSQVYDNVAGNWTPWLPAWSSPTDISATLPSAVASTTLLPGIVEQATTAKKYAKGDLRMRATAVYHYADNGYDPTKLTAGTEPNQTPIACISSYYDPSNASTAKNISTGSLTDVSGQVGLGTRQAFIGSNNGITYGPPKARPGASTLSATTGLLSGGEAALDMQANLVFPDGRFANKPLRDALQKADTARNLAEKAAIDSTNCALDILQGKLTLAPALIPHGAIKEVAFLDGREVKAIDKNDLSTTVDETFTLSSPLTGSAGAAKLTGKYDLALEERQPLEIRATVLDIGALRVKEITQTNDTGPKNASGKEYLLPYSGIIYATRDDALPDRSDRQPDSTGKFDENTSKTVSPTDSRLDPTRRPNGIMLINGGQLFRGATPTTGSVEDVVKEKGLTLVSNLPVYIKGDFNKHTKEEFTQPLNPTWSNFYTRNTLDPSFACRQGDPRLSGCTGDDWRPATVLGDAVTLLSGTFREGFRNEGDFDLRNNVGTAAVGPRRDQGFYNNNFVTNGLSSGAFNASGVVDGTPNDNLKDADYLKVDNNGLNSSYFNNFVTPIQRRGNYPEYLMEVCTKLPVSECTDDDWSVDPTATPTLKANGITLGSTPYNIATHKAGTTVDPPATALQRFPRRIAFQRDPSSKLANTPTDTKVTALGIDGSGNIAAFDSLSAVPRTKANSLWFATATSASPYPTPEFGDAKPLFFLNAVDLPGANDGFPFTDGVIKPPKITVALRHQPLLMPVLQIHATDSTSTTATTLPTTGINNAESTKWMLPASTPQEVNLIVGAGDIPSRNTDASGGSEFNGGVQNLPRFLENWKNGGISIKILGAFIQLNRSAYANAPYSQTLAGSLPQSAFSPTINTVTTWYPNKYKIGNNSSATPFFSPPARNWGFDVGLLSQPPDLFTQRFTTPSTKTKPAEFFREVPRDDNWVQTLMCAFIDDTVGTTQAVSSDLRPTDSFCKSKAGA